VAELRLGIYDWIPRSHIVAMTTFFDVWFDTSLFFGSGQVGSPGPEVILPQLFGAFGSFMEQIYEYPFTQLTNASEAEVSYSKYHPDGRRACVPVCVCQERR
jgi:hypothetical protein